MKLPSYESIASKACENSGNTNQFTKPTSGIGFMGVLEVLGDYKVHHTDGIQMALARPIDSGTFSKMVNAKLISRVKPGYFQLTLLGKDMLKSFRSEMKKAQIAG